MPIKLNSTGGGSVTLDVPGMSTANTLVLPAENGSIITTASNSGINASAASTGTLPSARLPSGSILQAVTVTLGTTWSAATSGNNFYDVTGLNASITPRNTSSRIIVAVGLYLGTSNYQTKFRITRNSSAILLGTSESGRPVATGATIPYNDNISTQQYSSNFLGCFHIDSPASSSALTYQIQAAAYDGQTIYVNRSHTWQNGGSLGYDAAPLSYITLLEIAG